MTTRTIGAILLILGILALVYGGFSYVQSSRETHVGPVDVTVQHRNWVGAPVWVGVAGAVVGGAILLSGRGRPSNV